MKDFSGNGIFENECGVKNKPHGELSLKWAIETYKLMQLRGVVLYGGGKEGALAIETLEREGIRVNAVADQCAGKTVGGRTSVSIAELCAKGRNEVCIVTPLKKVRGGYTGSWKNILKL